MNPSTNDEGSEIPAEIPELFRVTDDQSEFQYGIDPRSGPSPELGFGYSLDGRTTEHWKSISETGFDLTSALQALVKGENYAKAGLIELVTRDALRRELEFRKEHCPSKIRLWQIRTRGSYTRWETHFSSLMRKNIRMVVVYRDAMEAAAVLIHKNELAKLFQFSLLWSDFAEDMWFALHSIPSCLLLYPFYI